MSPKVFCIGFNKTGTTSLEQFMKIHGYSCGDQARGELLMRDYAKSNFEAILNFCHTADFFQDLPFSAPRTFSHLKESFPKALFILTVRNSAEEWYDSLIRFHERVFGKPLTPKLLKSAPYRYEGFAWEVNRLLYSSPDEDPYRKEDLISDYNAHIKRVRKSFSGDNNLLEINLSHPKSVSILCEYLNIRPEVDEMPWLNKSVNP
jgi:hypothetical protein